MQLREKNMKKIVFGTALALSVICSVSYAKKIDKESCKINANLIGNAVDTARAVSKSTIGYMEWVEKNVTKGDPTDPVVKKAANTGHLAFDDPRFMHVKPYTIKVMLYQSCLNGERVNSMDYF